MYMAQNKQVWYVWSNAKIMAKIRARTACGLTRALRSITHVGSNVTCRACLREVLRLALREYAGM
jgi:hypothetical protein